MDKVSRLRKWCETMFSQAKTHDKEDRLSIESSLDISISVSIEESPSLIEMTYELMKDGILDDGLVNIDLINQSISWRAISPESFQLFDGCYGNKMSYSTLSMIHSDPGSMHSLNTAYLVGKNFLVERALSHDNTLECKESPSMER